MTGLLSPELVTVTTQRSSIRERQQHMHNSSISSKLVSHSWSLPVITDTDNLPTTRIYILYLLKSPSTSERERQCKTFIYKQLFKVFWVFTLSKSFYIHLACSISLLVLSHPKTFNSQTWRIRKNLPPCPTLWQTFCISQPFSKWSEISLLALRLTGYDNTPGVGLKIFISLPNKKFDG